MSESNEYQIEDIDSNVLESTTTSPAYRKRKLTSDVWNAFTRYQNKKGEWRAKCNSCNNELGGDSKMGTTHLKRHLTTCVNYKRKNNNSKDISQLLLKKGEVTTGGTCSLENFKFNQEISRSDLAHMVILHEYPFSIVEHVGFKKFVRNLQPKFKMMSRNTIKGDCMKVYEEEREKLYEVLSKLRSRISLTSDLWSSNKNIGFICLTTHYIDESWKLQKKILNFCAIDPPHTGEAITKVILNMLFDWNVDAKVSSIVLDNCTTNDVVARELNVLFNGKTPLLLGGELFHVRCCTHILNLIVQDGLEPIRDALYKVRESVRYVISSQKRQFKFAKAVDQVNGPKKSVILDVPTRWNSTYLMLDVAKSFRDAFTRLSMIDEEYKFCLTEEEWDNVCVIHKCLKVFYDTTEYFSGTKYPTANIYFPRVCKIHIVLKEYLVHVNPFVVGMASKLMKKFEKYWGITSKVLSIASILDPRQKMKPVEFLFRKLYGALEADKKIKDIQFTLTSLHSEYALNTTNKSFSSFGTSSAGACSTNLDSGLHVGDDPLDELHIYIQESSSSQQNKSDLDLYLEDSVYPGMNNEFDILGWWKFNSAKYPILSMVARDILGIPVSTVASESAFSTGGRVLDQYQSSLNSKTVEGLICAQDWLRDQLEVSSLQEGLSTVFNADIVENEVDGCALGLEDDI